MGRQWDRNVAVRRSLRAASASAIASASGSSQGVPSYGSITFPEVYPGIDWVVKSEPGEGYVASLYQVPGEPNTVWVPVTDGSGVVQV